MPSGGGVAPSTGGSAAPGYGDPQDPTREDAPARGYEPPTAEPAAPAFRPASAPGRTGGTQAAAGGRKAATSAVPTQGGTVQYARQWRRARLVIRKIDPWSTLKFASLFYFCLLLIMLLGSAIIFAILKAFGVIGRVEDLLASLSFDVHITGGSTFRWLFLFGLLGTIVSTAVTVFLAFLYNLIADVVGGIEIAVSQRD